MAPGRGGRLVLDAGWKKGRGGERESVRRGEGRGGRGWNKTSLVVSSTKREADGMESSTELVRGGDGLEGRWVEWKMMIGYETLQKAKSVA